MAGNQKKSSHSSKTRANPSTPSHSNLNLLAEMASSQNPNAASVAPSSSTTPPTTLTPVQAFPVNIYIPNEATVDQLETIARGIAQSLQGSPVVPKLTIGSIEVDVASYLNQPQNPSPTVHVEGPSSTVQSENPKSSSQAKSPTANVSKSVETGDQATKETPTVKETVAEETREKSPNAEVPDVEMSEEDKEESPKTDSSMSEDSEPAPIAKAVKKKGGKRKRSPVQSRRRSGRAKKRVNYSETARKKKDDEGDVATRPIRVFSESEKESSSKDSSEKETDQSESQEKEETDESDVPIFELRRRARVEMRTKRKFEYATGGAGTSAAAPEPEADDSSSDSSSDRTKTDSDQGNASEHSVEHVSSDNDDDESLDQKLERLRKRNLLIERKINIDEFESKGLVRFLEERSLMHAVTFADAFVTDWVYEFYACLRKNQARRNSRWYGAVRFRDRSVPFTPKLINQFLHVEDVEEEDVPHMDEIITVLTGGRVNKWKKNMLAASLTSLYSVLHKLVVYNWIPSTNSTKVTRDQAVLMYRIGVMKFFNLGLVIFHHMMKFAGKISEKGNLPYPVLIYGYLRSHNFIHKRNELLRGRVHLMGISHYLLSGNRVLDLPLQDNAEEEDAEPHQPVPDPAPAQDAAQNAENIPSNIPAPTTYSLNISPEFIQTQLKHLQDSIDELQFLKNYWENLLSATTGGVPVAAAAARGVEIHEVNADEPVAEEGGATGPDGGGADAAADVVANFATFDIQEEDELYGDLPDISAKV